MNYICEHKTQKEFDEIINTLEKKNDLNTTKNIYENESINKNKIVSVTIHNSPFINKHNLGNSSSLFEIIDYPYITSNKDSKILEKYHMLNESNVTKKDGVTKLLLDYLSKHQISLEQKPNDDLYKKINQDINYIGNANNIDKNNDSKKSLDFISFDFFGDISEKVNQCKNKEDLLYKKIQKCEMKYVPKERKIKSIKNESIEKKINNTSMFSKNNSSRETDLFSIKKLKGKDINVFGITDNDEICKKIKGNIPFYKKIDLKNKKLDRDIKKNSENFSKNKINLKKSPQKSSKFNLIEKENIHIIPKIRKKYKIIKKSNMINNKTLFTTRQNSQVKKVGKKIKKSNTFLGKRIENNKTEANSIQTKYIRYDIFNMKKPVKYNKNPYFKLLIKVNRSASFKL